MCVEATHRSVLSFFPKHALLSATLLSWNQRPINLSSLLFSKLYGFFLFHLQNSGNIHVCHCTQLSNLLLGIQNQVLMTNILSTQPSFHAGDQFLFIVQLQLPPKTGGRHLPGKPARNLMVQENWVGRDKEAFPGQTLQQPSRVRAISRIYAQTTA